MSTSRTLLVSTPRRRPRPDATVRPIDPDGFPVLTIKEADILEFLYTEGVSLIPASRDTSDAWRQTRSLELFGLVVMTPDTRAGSGDYGPYRMPQHHAWTVALTTHGQQCLAARIARTMPDVFPRGGRK